MEELQNDNSCLTCVLAETKNEDKWGNPEYVKCKLKNENMSIDELCKKFTN